MHASFSALGPDSARSSFRGDSVEAKRRWWRDPSVRPAAWGEGVAVLVLAAVILLFAKDIVGDAMSKARNVGWQTPPGSASLAARKHVDDHFGSKKMEGTILMALEAKPPTSSVLTDVVAQFSKNVSRAVAADPRVQRYEAAVFGYFLDVLGHHPPKDVMKKELVSADEKMTLIVMQPTNKPGGNFNAANEFLQEYCANPPPGYDLHITGMPALATGNGCSSGVHAVVNPGEMSFDCLFKAEVVTTPLALLLMACLVKFHRLLLLPLLTVAISFAIVCIVLQPAMEKVDVPPDGIAAMGSVILAFCLDYSLFILSRFSENCLDRFTLQENIDILKKQTCRTCAVSGSLVAIAFLGGIMFPERNLQGTCMALGIATICCTVTSVVLLPAVLVVTGNLFTGASFLPTWWGDFELHGYVDGDSQDAVEQPRSRDSIFWLTVMRVVEHSPLASLALVTMALWPILSYAPSIHVTADRFAMMPFTSPAVGALRHIQDRFPVGVMEPYNILITAPPQPPDLEVSVELRDGLKSLASHDLRPWTAQLGLSKEEASALNAALSELGSAEAKHSCSGTTCFQDLLRGVMCLGNRSTPQKPDCQCCPNPILDCRLCEFREHCSPAEEREAIRSAAFLLRTEGAASTNESTVASAAPAVKQQSKEELEKLRHCLHAAEGLDFSASDLRTAMEAVLAVGKKGVHAAEVEARAAGAKVENLETKHPRPDVHELSSETGAAAATEAEKHGIDLKAAAVEAEADVHKLSSEASAASEAAVAEAGKHGIDLRAAAEEVEAEVKKRGVDPRAAALISAALGKAQKKGAIDENNAMGSAVEAGRATEKELLAKFPFISEIVAAVQSMSDQKHGMLLLPSGFAAVHELCEAVQNVGSVSSMLSPWWLYHEPIDWAMAVAAHGHIDTRDAYRPLLGQYVDGSNALLQVHTQFPPIGAGSGDWALATRKVIASWEASHPGYKAELAGGNSEAADIRTAIMHKMWSYLFVSTSAIMVVVYVSFGSVMVPLRLALALFFTLAATFGVGAIVYQTPLLHSLFPQLKYYHGITYEVVPMVTGICIALGLDYDIFLVSRIVEFRLQRYSDRASVFRGVLKTGDVISGAGIIMSMAFSGLLFSDKMFFQQFGVLLITSVMIDTFVVRTVLVPALMLTAQGWNWWPRQMPPAIHDVLEGEVESSGGLSRPIMAGTALDRVA